MKSALETDKFYRFEYGPAISKSAKASEADNSLLSDQFYASYQLAFALKDMS